jgi:hypothetical protein
MKNRVFIVLCFVIFVGFCFLLIAQFTPEEIAEREKWEKFLKTAEIIGKKQLGNPDLAITPWKLTLEKDGISRGALWKKPEGRLRGFDENWKWEIAAYRLDKHLEINMVPPTVERMFQEEQGSCQLWVTAEMDLKRKMREGIKTPTNKVYSWNKAIYLQRAFDNLIANIDRHQGSILLTKDWRLILVDHNRCFSTSKKYTTELIFTEKHELGPRVMRMLPRSFVEKLKALNFELVKETVEDYLTDKEIEAVLKRKDLILEEIARLIAIHGEDDVLY